MKGRQDVKGGDERGGKKQTREPIPLNCPAPCLKVAPLRLEERTLQGPGGKQTKKPQEAPQLSRVCHRPCSRVRTAGDGVLQSGWAPGKSTAGRELAPPLPRQARPLPGPPSTQDTWLRVLLHRLFPDFSLTQLIHSLWFPQLLRDLVSSPFHSPPQSDLYDNKQVSPSWSSWRELYSSTLRIQAQGVQRESHTEWMHGHISSPKGCPTASNVECLPYYLIFLSFCTSD